jgi:hypothetical protein
MHNRSSLKIHLAKKNTKHPESADSEKDVLDTTPVRVRVVRVYQMICFLIFGRESCDALSNAQNIVVRSNIFFQYIKTAGASTYDNRDLLESGANHKALCG